MATLQRGAKGLDVTRLEIRLNELGLYTQKLDDTFGPGVEAGVRTFQQQRGLPVTGVVDAATREALFADPSPRLAAVQGRPAAYRALALTAGFETGSAVPDCFCRVAGNFDGQGISFGVLQWNLGQRTLQPLLQRLESRHPQVLRQAFGDLYPSLRQMLQQEHGAQLAWARTIQDDRHRVAKPWRDAFAALGRTDECQEAQAHGAADRYQSALQLARRYELRSQRGVTLMFDVVVQNGSIGKETHQRIAADFQGIPADLSPQEREVARMRIIANRRAEAANPRFVADVRSRKLTIAEGVGIVHEKGYDLERQYDLTLAPMPEA